MSPTYLWLALFIVIFDLVALVTNFRKLQYHAHWSKPRLIIGFILAVGLGALLLFVVRRQDVIQTIIISTFLLTVVTWLLLRKGLGQKYVLISLSTNGLKDWRAIRDYRVEKVAAGVSKLTLIDYGQREYPLLIDHPVAEIQGFVEQKITKPVPTKKPRSPKK